MKKVLKIVGIVLLVLIVIGMFGNKKEPAKTAETVAEATAEPKAEPQAEPEVEAEQIEEAIEEVAEEAEPDQLSVDDIVTLYEITLSNNFTDDGQGYKIEQDDNIIMIYVWSDGITNEALRARYNDEYKAAWDNMVDSFKGSSESFQNVLDENGHSDVSSAINVLNDKNKDNVLLSVLDGVVLYDAVNDIDLIS